MEREPLEIVLSLKAALGVARGCLNLPTDGKKQCAFRLREIAALLRRGEVAVGPAVETNSQLLLDMANVVEHGYGGVVDLALSAVIRMTPGDMEKDLKEAVSGVEKMNRQREAEGN